ncbi:MAG: hypothetical protein V1763_02130 [Parcubacteria group bacterium]
MSIPLSVFLFAYLFFVACFLFFTYFNLFHMMKYGFTGFGAWVITVGYIALTVLALFVSYISIAQIDWSQTFDLFSFTGNIL